MEEGSTWEFRKSSNLYLRKHFICHRRVCDKGTAFLCHRGCRSRIIDHHCNIISKKSTEITCMNAFFSCHEGITHLLIDLIYTCTYRGYQTSACHCHINRFQFDSLFLEKISNGVTTHRSLVHHRLISGDLFSRVSKIGFEELLTCIVKSYLA